MSLGLKVGAIRWNMIEVAQETVGLPLGKPSEDVHSFVLIVSPRLSYSLTRTENVVRGAKPLRGLRAIVYM